VSIGLLVVRGGNRIDLVRPNDDPRDEVGHIFTVNCWLRLLLSDCRCLPCPKGRHFSY
jgi:hypothetical protein